MGKRSVYLSIKAEDRGREGGRTGKETSAGGREMGLTLGAEREQETSVENAEIKDAL